MTLEIRPYQAEGIEFLAERMRAGLFDRPGLGKSMQSLLTMNDTLDDGARILVVAPGDALGVWQDEAAKWLGEEAPVYAGLKAKPAMLAHQGVVITNYARLGQSLDYGHWDGVIFDESQMLRNRNTRTLFKTVKSYFDPKRFGYHDVPAYFLSGTPIVKSVGDVWPILHLIDKKRWSSFWRFVNEYAITYRDPIHGHMVIEEVKNVTKLWDELATVILRRTRGEVELPPKTRYRIPLEMTPTQRKVYKSVEDSMMAEVGDGYLLAPTALARETRLRQLLVCPRLVGVDDDGAILPALADFAWRSDEPFVVFTPFTEALPYYQAYLDRTNRPIWSIHGGMGARFHQYVNEYKAAAANGEQPILLAQIAMGKSWDVSATTHQIFFAGTDWNEVSHEQAEDRADRNGQEKGVMSGYFVHQDSHDFDQLEVVAGKKRLADLIIDRKLRRKRRTR